MGTIVIQYPIGRTVDGLALHIEAWERGVLVTCFGCGQDLIGRLPHDGIKPTAHFAHKADVACSGETALHKAAKAAIVQAHGNKTLQAIVWTCPHCKRFQHRTDLQALALVEESRPCEGVTSDVLGTDSTNTPRVAIEVVVTHDIDPDTLARYQACDGLHVFSLRSSWGLVGDITRGADLLKVDYRLGVVDAACPGCQQIQAEQIEWQAREKMRQERAWWDAWIALWHQIWREKVIFRYEAQQVLERQHARERVWWNAWECTWPKIADQLIHEWWSAWLATWRAIGSHLARPHLWWKAWLIAWGAIGKQHAADEAARQRRLVEEKSRESLRGEIWWAAWLKLWPEIGQRASGLMAAWKPICRRCRQDLMPNHQCPTEM